MIRNGSKLLQSQPLVNMADQKHRFKGVSYGLSEGGYDIRLKQDIEFKRDKRGPYVLVDGQASPGTFTIASAIEEFQMPEDLLGLVHDKSTWARKGLSVFNTVIEPGWKGFLTLELVYHAHDNLFIPAGSGIAQVVFHELNHTAAYDGKYQDQKDQPIHAIFEGE